MAAHELHPDEEFIASLTEKAPGYHIDVYKVRRTNGTVLYDLRTIIDDPSPRGTPTPAAARSVYITPENLHELAAIAREQGISR